MEQKIRKVIITGASSGIGRALAKELAHKGYALGLMARRESLLKDLAAQLTVPVWTSSSDFENPNQAILDFEKLLGQMGEVELVVLNAGVNGTRDGFLWAPDHQMIQVNIASFVALGNAAMRYFLARGGGHLVGVSSIAGIRGGGKGPVYGATKAFVIAYLEGLRQRARAACPAVWVTDIRPGFVDTALIRESRVRFWVSTPEEAARQIVQAIYRKKKSVYVTRRWGLAAFIFKWVPDFIYDWVYKRYLWHVRL